MNYNFNQLRVTFFMFKMLILMFYWYLQGILLMGPILQLKLHHMRDKFCHIWDGFSLVCYLLIDKRYLRMICYVPKLLKKNSKFVIFKKMLHWLDAPCHLVNGTSFRVWSSFHVLYINVLFVNTLWRNWFVQSS